MERLGRISEEIKKELGSIILSELKDPRVSMLISVLEVDVAKDLKTAKVYVSILGSDEDKQNALEGLKSAAGFMRKEIGKRVQLRHTPELKFELDNSIERGMHINDLINKALKDNN